VYTAPGDKKSKAILEYIHKTCKEFPVIIMIYKWAQKAGVFVPGKPFQTRIMQHSSLLGIFIIFNDQKNILTGLINIQLVVSI
jgi:hypothetical protein